MLTSRNQLQDLEFWLTEVRVEKIAFHIFLSEPVPPYESREQDFRKLIAKTK